jgi:hypothetical protein
VRLRCSRAVIPKKSCVYVILTLLFVKCTKQFVPQVQVSVFVARFDQLLSEGRDVHHRSNQSFLWRFLRGQCYYHMSNPPITSIIFRLFLSEVRKKMSTKFDKDIFDTIHDTNQVVNDVSRDIRTTLYVVHQLTPAI